MALADTLTSDPAALARSWQEMSNAIRDQAMRLNRMVSQPAGHGALGKVKRRRTAAPSAGNGNPLKKWIGASIQMLGTGITRPCCVCSPLSGPTCSWFTLTVVLMERVFGNLIENAATIQSQRIDHPRSALKSAARTLTCVNQQRGLRLPTRQASKTCLTCLSEACRSQLCRAGSGARHMPGHRRSPWWPHWGQQPTRRRLVCALEVSVGLPTHLRAGMGWGATNMNAPPYH